MPVNPPIIEKTYNHQLPGVYGQFGTGAGVRAFYLQSALTPAQLDWVSLISDIRGSERWPVRDLFQRDVDNDRISSKDDGLLAYLQDSQKTKFFNPLTLTLLPMQENSDLVLTQMPRVYEGSMTEDGREWKVLERKKYHRLRWIKGNPEYAILDWSDLRTKLVAIDGQHRLSALKRFWSDTDASSHQNFTTWRIPVVIVSFRVDSDRNNPPTVLEVVRSIFIYINTEAKPVNRARRILLSDKSVNAICTQEFVQLSHANDLLTPKDRNLERLPLLFFDWRGEESERRRVHAPASVKSVEEIHDWFERYILGPDFKGMQETAFGINPTMSLYAIFRDERLWHSVSDDLRELVRNELLPALSHLLENFNPYRTYIVALRKLEEKYENESQSDLARHAFYELRFGSNLAPEAIKPDVETLLIKIADQIEETKKRLIPKPLDQDLGMRGIVCAFGTLRRSFGNPDWNEFATWFVNALNSAYENGWFALRAPKRGHLRHVVEDHNETVVNYRLEDADGAFGSYVQLLVASYGQPFPDTWTADWPAAKELLLDKLVDTVLRGYKREIRPQIRDKFPDGGRPLTEAVNAEAEKRSGRQIRRLEQQLRKIEGATVDQ